jgi:aromatic ring-opening dioxygenase catalytic subunit (LigB family)
MADIVGIYAATHTPVMLTLPDAIPSDDRETIYETFRALGRHIAQANPQTIVVISNDHLHNFFLDNLPAFCFGAADAYPTPIESWLNAEKRTLPGDARLGAYLIGEAQAASFDPSFSLHLTLDHGALTPLELAELPHPVAIVPILVNCVQPPLPLMQRCLQLGRFLGRALRAYEGLQRVAILATGGLSHDVGTPRMGMVNEAFDREFLRLLGAGNDDALVQYATEHVNEAGNGAEEIRNWLIAHGAAGGVTFDVFYYKAMPDWYTGIALVGWGANVVCGAGRPESKTTFAS